MSVLKQAALRAVLASSILGAPMLAQAQSGAVAPRAQSQPQPPRPVNASGMPVGGWAVVRYFVRADGTTDEVRVLDTVPPGIDAAPIRTAVEDWTFTPAMANGEAVEWYNGEAVVSFSEPAAGDSSADLSDDFKDVAAMIDAEQFDEALAASGEILNEKATSKRDLALALAQMGIILFSQGDPDRALRNLQLATDPRAVALSGDDLLGALQLRIRLEIELGRAREAIATHQRIAAALDPGTTDPYIAVANELRQRWNTAQFLEVIARIDDEPWRFDLGRRYFYIDNVTGTIDSIDIECDTRRLSIDFNPEADYQLPDSFGNCTLFVSGSPGTTFSYFGVLPAEE